MDESGFASVAVLGDGAWVDRVASTLAAEGIAVHRASGCEETLQLLQFDNCRVLIADVTHEDGAALALMSQVQVCGISGVAITSGRSGRLRRAAARAGFSVCVSKPVRLHRVVAAVRKLLMG